MCADRKSVISENRQRTTVKASQNSSYNTKENRSYSLSKKNVFLGLFFRCYTSTRWSSYKTLSSKAACASSTENNTESGDPVAKSHVQEIKFNRVNCLVWVLHESAKSFSLAIESLELTGSSPELAMAWIGKDVHRWHKRIAYMVHHVDIVGFCKLVIYVCFMFLHVFIVFCLELMLHLILLSRAKVKCPRYIIRFNEILINLLITNV